jgi:exopolysaccharide production protein ExoQ
MIVLNQTHQDYVADFLGALGKDTTFTGRTHIWSAGRLAAEEHPIIGLGLEGFWNPSNGAAQSINEMDFKPYGTKLTFHNAYLEVRVHLGYIGLGLYLLMWAWCGYRLLMQFFRDSSLEMSALLVFGAIVFISTFTESLAWASFNTPLNLLYLGALATLSPVRRTYVGKAPVYLSSSPGYAKA